MLGAYVLYGFRHQVTFDTLESGKLLSPAVPIQSLSVHDESYLGKWQLIYLSPEPCHPICETWIMQLNQIHLALGKEYARVIHRVAAYPKLTQFSEGSLLLVDPQGWVILQYDSHANPKGIIKDVQRLLRLSHVG